MFVTVSWNVADCRRKQDDACKHVLCWHLPWWHSSSPLDKKHASILTHVHCYMYLLCTLVTVDQYVISVWHEQVTGSNSYLITNRLNWSSLILYFYSFQLLKIFKKCKDFCLSCKFPRKPVQYCLSALRSS